MIATKELKRWLATLDGDSCVGIDEGGLTLHEISEEEGMGGAYMEVGGIPEEIEHGV